jgi:hypothetical protein
MQEYNAYYTLIKFLSTYTFADLEPWALLCAMKCKIFHVYKMQLEMHVTREKRSHNHIKMNLVPLTDPAVQCVCFTINMYF